MEFKNPMFSEKTERFVESYLTNVPYNYQPKEKIPLWLIIEFGRIAIGEINKARCHDDVPVCREEAIRKIKLLAETHCVDHLVDYESFLYV